MARHRPAKGDRRAFVLDTNVLLHDARALFSFADNNVVIPIYVIEEVDTFKKDQSELGRNARQVARLLDEVRHKGSLATAQPLPTAGTVRVALSKNPPKTPSYDSRSMDQRILEIYEGSSEIQRLVLARSVRKEVEDQAR